MWKQLVIACGGTGGHFYPTLSIARAWVKRGYPVTLVISGKNQESQIQQAKQEGFPVISCPSVRRPPLFSLAALSFPFRFYACYQEAKRILKNLPPALVLGMGSYASVPVCMACPKDVPLFLLEGNAFMGKANRMFAARAAGIGLSLPLADESQCKGRLSRFVGMPLREQIVEAAANPEPDMAYLPALGLQNGVKTILIFGGSQGAQRINEGIMKALPFFTKWGNKLQFIHLTGSEDNTDLERAYNAAGLHASVRCKDTSIEKSYLASDLVICRGGASTLCELALFAKPAVIIPLPSAADDHQSFNARLAEKINGAIHLPQAELSPERLCAILERLLASPNDFRIMGENLHSLAHADAAEAMVQFMDELTSANTAGK